MTRQLSLFPDLIPKPAAVECVKGPFRQKKMKKLQRGESRRERLLKILAADIFGGKVELDSDEYFFAYLKTVEYYGSIRHRGYLPTIQKKVRPILGGRYFTDKENELVLKLYIQRIPTFIIFRAVTAVKEYATASGKAINSLYYFNGRFQAEFERKPGTDAMSIRDKVNRILTEGENKWHYLTWKRIFVDKDIRLTWHPFFGVE